MKHKLVLKHPFPRDNNINRFGDYDTLVTEVSRTKYRGKVSRKYYLLPKDRSLVMKKLTRRQFLFATEFLFWKSAKQFGSES